MISITSQESSQNTVRLRKIFLIYQTNHSNGESFVTVHDPLEVRKQLFVGAGRLLTPTEWAKIVHSTKLTTPAPLALFDHRLLYCSGELLVWFEKPSVQRLFFKEEDDSCSSIKAAIPGLIYVANLKGLSVWAYKNDERPSASTELFQAPFYNIYDTGAVCRGTSRYPDSLGMDSIDAWENAFWMSAFSHPNTQRLVKGSYRHFLKRCEGKISFQENDSLLPLHKTLGSIFESLLQ